jgi:hypothetical protein
MAIEGGEGPKWVAEHLLGDRARRHGHPKPVRAGERRRIGDLFAPRTALTGPAGRVTAPATRYVTRTCTPVDAYREGRRQRRRTARPVPGGTASSCRNVIGDVTVTYADRDHDRGDEEVRQRPPPAPRTGTSTRGWDRRRTRRPPADPHRGRHHQRRYTRADPRPVERHRRGSVRRCCTPSPNRPVDQVQPPHQVRELTRTTSTATCTATCTPGTTSTSPTSYEFEPRQEQLPP